MNTEKELNNDGGNAYPFAFENKSNHVVIIDGYELPAGHAIVNTGMTLRDYFAAKAMQGMHSNHDFTGNTASEIAKFSYVVADAMLAERAK